MLALCLLAFVGQTHAAAVLVGTQTIGPAVNLISLQWATNVTTLVNSSQADAAVLKIVYNGDATPPGLSSVLSIGSSASGPTYTLASFPGGAASDFYSVTFLLKSASYAFLNVSARVIAGNVVLPTGTASTKKYTGVCQAPAPYVAPAFSNAVAALTVALSGATNWKRWMEWGSEAAVAATGGFSVNTTSWNPQTFWIASESRLQLTLRPGLTYRLTLPWRQDLANNYNGVPVSNSSISSIIAVLSSARLGPGWSIPVDAHLSAPTEFYAAMGPTPLGGNLATLTTTTLQFTVSKVINSPFLSFRFLMPSSGSGASPDRFFFGAISVQRLAYTAATPSPLQTGASEFVTIPEAPTVVLPPVSNCPHLQTGLLRWEDPASWGGAVPAANSAVVLPSNSKILVSGCSFLPEGYSSITIPATSELIFNNHDISLTTPSIYVQGALRMGSETCRLSSKITITFTGPATTADVIGPNCGAKGVCTSTSGIIDMHGQLYQKSWTRLAFTAFSGDERAYLQQPVNWRAGQLVAVTTTVFQDEVELQNEVLTVAAVSSDGKIVRFTTAFKYTHYAGPEYQAEVALLSRDILLQGDASSEASQFGGHLLVRGQGRFSGIQGYRMGQKNMLARYPFHYHMIGAAPTSWIKDSSVYRSFFRCYTIHGTHQVLLDRNVAYDVIGNCYYLEDGVEENNTLSYNFGGFVHTIGTPAAGASQVGEVFTSSSTLLIPSDRTAAPFYATNAYNSWIGNAASGGWTGFSFPNLPKPIGAYASVVMQPQLRPLRLFEGNTAHSSGYYWGDAGCIYSGGQLWYPDGSTVLNYSNGRYSRSTQLPDGSPSWMRFSNTKVFLCNKGINHWGERAEIVSYEAHDIGRAATTFGESWVTKALINAVSGNPVKFVGLWPGTSQGFQFYDTSVKTILTNVTFRNFKSTGLNYTDPTQNNCGIISMTHSDVFKPQGISAVKNIVWQNTDQKQQICHYARETGSSRYYNFIDYAGTAVSRNGIATMVGSHLSWWQISSDCYLSMWNVWVCNKVAGTEVAHIKIFIPGLITKGVTSDSFNYEVARMHLFGSPVSPGRSVMVTRNEGITGPVSFSVGWFFSMPNGSPSSLTVVPGIIPTGARLLWAFPYPAATTFTVKANYEWYSPNSFNLSPAASVAEVLNNNGTKYFFDGSNLYLNVAERNYIAPFVRDGVPLYQDHVWSGWSYIITAACPTISNGYCALTPFALPPAF
eukprot:TRINITY_DN152_c0_g2_i4.p1 TRINITY_DN152_c0_g2~~TRINITY_DN152_c0_g2_i4.p1  ORF type:complete len:1231 (+),score=275.22 TRINITY_DN152_c0_g2_i4:31-3693(+)